MGQKVNPHGLRVGVIKNWDSRWFASDETFGDTLVSDYKIRKYLKARLQNAGVPKIEIERDGKGAVRLFIHCAKPGMIIGRGGSEIEKLRADVEKLVGAPVSLNVVEVKNIDLNAQLVAENIASQLERRISFRRAMKQSIGRTMMQGAKGIKIAVSGRLGGAEIARTEHYHDGTIPLQTIRADIDYGFWEANTTYGKIGVKVWIYNGEVLSEVARTGNNNDKRQRRDRKDGRRDDRRGDRKGGDRRNSGERKGDGQGRRDRKDGQGRGPRREDTRNINAGARATRTAPKAAPKQEGGDA